eukprot:CAMPEP_0206460170 /NCGR_PEP_ID=MMETSP0324_2-20121206/24606_1 /ASSEMBLY_ACC=CAM_ASM_000836 /TAXON_ID=2866 /ORGANISM="Crypthecodinium cohnii, Strain Seligo" /LENGTH=83 /DNA_ID=CAMNT_0053931849 /DNA_START=230 /DNA_END=480 /DNA_ORIENTATION=-
MRADMKRMPPASPSPPPHLLFSFAFFACFAFFASAESSIVALFSTAAAAAADLAAGAPAPGARTSARLWQTFAERVPDKQQDL